MSQTLQLRNYSSSNISEPSALYTASVANDTSFTLENNNAFSANDFMLIGKAGGERTELLQVSGISGGSTVTTLTGAKYPHYVGDSVVKLFGNQLKVYRAANSTGLQPADTAFSLLGTPVTIDIDQDSTSFTDATGDTNYWYKYTFYNSVTTNETSLASAIAVRGGNYGNYAALDDIRAEAGFTNARYVTDSMIDSKRQAAQSEINSSLGGFYTTPFTAPVSPFISDIATRLAAGLLLLEQYTSYDVVNTQNGKTKVDMARADIAKIQAGTIVLQDATGASIKTDLAGDSDVGVAGWPNNETPADQSFYNGRPLAGSGDFKFRVNDRY